MAEATDRLTKTRAILKESLAERYESIKPCDEFEEGVVQELEHLSRFVVNADTRTLCILMVSYLEDALKQNFIRFWNIDGNEALDRHFGSNGPLSSFSQRALVAAGLTWLTPIGLHDANILRKIRNEFAHNHRVHSFTEGRVRDLVGSLKPRENYLGPIDVYGQALERADTETRMRVRLFASAALLAAQILSRSKLLWNGLGSFKPKGGYNAAMAVEQRTIDLTVRHNFAVLGLDWDQVKNAAEWAARDGSFSHRNDL